jgi:hypothetical protein
MNKLLVLSVCAVLMLAGIAVAEEKVPNDVPGEPGQIVPCPTEGYKSYIFSFEPPLAIPDNGSTVSGFLFTGEGTGELMSDVIIAIKADHTWVGDLVASVHFHPDCAQQTPDTQLLCRQNRTSGCFGTSGFGCSGNLVSANTYEFSDDAAAELGEPTCPTTIPSGCYKPSAESTFPLSQFEGLSKDGCWFFTFSDQAAGDVGSVSQITISVANAPNSTETASWGGVKALFR